MQALKSTGVADDPPPGVLVSVGALPHAARASATAPVSAAAWMIFFTRNSWFSSFAGPGARVRRHRPAARRGRPASIAPHPSQRQVPQVLPTSTQPISLRSRDIGSSDGTHRPIDRDAGAEGGAGQQERAGPDRALVHLEVALVDVVRAAARC